MRQQLVQVAIAAIMLSGCANSNQPTEANVHERNPPIACSESDCVNPPFVGRLVYGETHFPAAMGACLTEEPCDPRIVIDACSITDSSHAVAIVTLMGKPIEHDIQHDGCPLKYRAPWRTLDVRVDAVVAGYAIPRRLTVTSIGSVGHSLEADQQYLMGLRELASGGFWHANLSVPIAVETDQSVTGGLSHNWAVDLPTESSSLSSLLEQRFERLADTRVCEGQRRWFEEDEMIEFLRQDGCSRARPEETSPPFHPGEDQNVDE
jgi:hypothetical protein